MAGRSALAAHGLALCAGMLALFLPLPPQLGMALRYDYVVVPLLFAFGLYVGRGRPWLTTGCCALCCALLLRGLWASGVSSDYLMLGRLPFSDAASYYEAALRLLTGEPLSEFGTRRPLYSSFLAGALFVCQGALPGALALAAACIAGVMAYAVLACRRLAGLWPSIALGVLLLFYMRRFIGITSSETIGISLGLLAIVLLLEAAADKKPWRWAGGLAMLSLALNARAGAFFVLPTVWIWGLLQLHTSTWRGKVRLGILGGMAMLVGFFANAMLIKAFGAPGGGGFSNFAPTLYGLLVGGDWTTLAKDHPELAAGKEGVAAHHIYALCKELVLADPFRLVRGVLRAWREAYFGEGAMASFLVIATPGSQSFSEHLRALVAAPIETVSQSPLTTVRHLAQGGWYALAVVGHLLSLWWLRKAWRTPMGGLLLAMWIGIMCSTPFAPPWDANSMRAYAATLLPLCLLPIMGWSLVAPPLRPRPGETPATAPWAAPLCGALLALACMGGAFATHGAYRPEPCAMPKECLPGSIRVCGEARLGADVALTNHTWLGVSPTVANEAFYQFTPDAILWRRIVEASAQGESAGAAWVYDTRLGSLRGPAWGRLRENMSCLQESRPE